MSFNRLIYLLVIYHSLNIISSINQLWNDQAERKMQLCVSLYIKQPYQLENPVINPAAYFNTSKASAESIVLSPFTSAIFS